MRIHTLLLGLLFTGAALAEPDTFGLGTGRNGMLRVDLPDTVINHAAQLTANAAAGTKDLTIANASSFAAGELVLVHQSAGLLPAPASGDQRTLNLNSSTVGRFEYARVVAPIKERAWSPGAGVQRRDGATWPMVAGAAGAAATRVRERGVRERSGGDQWDLLVQSVGIEVDGKEVARVPPARAAPWPGPGPATKFEVKAPAALEVGCGCGASPGAGLGLTALLLGLGATRLRRRE